MSTLLQFVLVMLVASTLFGVLGWLMGAVQRRLRHWPSLWAALLGMSLAIPLLGLLLAALPSLSAVPMLDLPLLHAPMDALAFSAVDSSNRTVAAGNHWQPALLTLSAVIYVLGALLQLLRLAAGRRRVARIAATATRTVGPCGSTYWIHDDIADTGHGDASPVSWSLPSPFAYTPLGRPRHSRIVVPSKFAGQLTTAELSDVLAHERAHLARRDDELGLLLRIVRALCWISPFAHWLFARWSASVELQCDLAVTENRCPRMRKAYAATLLKALHITANRVWAYPAASFSTHHLRSEQMRISSILTGQASAFKQSRHQRLLGQLALGVLAVSSTALAAASFSARADTGAGGGESGHRVVSTMIDGRVSAGYGERFEPFKDGKKRQHNGVDIVAAVGTPIKAPADGVIVTATDLYDGKPDYGKVVVIETEGAVRTLFAHLDGYPVAVGQQVHQGEPIARVGITGKTTGPHVHIETYRGDKRVDPTSVWQSIK